CKAILQSQWQYIKGSAPHYVMFASRWSRYVEHEANQGIVLPKLKEYFDINSLGDQRRTFKAAFDANLSLLQRQGSQAIIITEPPRLPINPRYCWAVPDVLINEEFLSARCIKNGYQQTSKDFAYIDSYLSSLASDEVLVLSLTDALCNHKNKRCRQRSKGRFIYGDRLHLNYEGSMFAKKKLRKDIIDFLADDHGKKNSG
ncbi:MAG: hypothetical protein HRU21_13260, partial [Pseudomonadales bacterium]|nr:hypothetical protein [Pseudomonadales bacterium]